MPQKPNSTQLASAQQQTSQEKQPSPTDKTARLPTQQNATLMQLLTCVITSQLQKVFLVGCEEASRHCGRAYCVNGGGSQLLIVLLDGDGVLNQVPEEAQGAANTAHLGFKRLQG